MTNLFEASNINDISSKPLAEKLRPQTLTDIVGQEHLLVENSTLYNIINGARCPSMILWGPAGCGKTTLARLLANHVDIHFESISAIFSGVADLKKIFMGAKHRHEMGNATLLFVDEIHRFNKSQQDAFLPYVEDGTIILVGATTENPSFRLNSALLSRCQVITLKKLDNEALEKILLRAENEMNKKLNLTKKAREQLKAMAHGDGRYLLNMTEHLLSIEIDNTIDIKELSEILQSRSSINGQENHYDLASALQKSVRGSDPDAALYWFARMIEGGEDPCFIARRILRIASEDIGLADPQAMNIALAAWQSYERLGTPEGELALAEALVYMATAPKSNAVYSAYKTVIDLAKETGSLNPPKHILNAPTEMMKELGYGQGYLYDHDTENGFSGQTYLPDELTSKQFYSPVERGFEREISKRIDYWNKLREKIKE